MIEREVKLGAAPGFHLPDLAEVVDGVSATAPEERRLETTYFDTVDLRLARWGCSLRHRAGEGWTLKLPAASEGIALSRQEIEFPGPAGRVPAAATRMVRAYARGIALQPVARLSTWRRKVRLLDGSGAEVAEVVDDEVSILDGRRVAARFRELEVEVRPGAPEDLLELVVRRLRTTGAGAPDPTPKHVRALGPMAADNPEVLVTAPSPTATVGEVVRNVVAASVLALMTHDPGVRAGGDAEDVHQARVATRRLRSNLRTFRSLLDAAWMDWMSTELGWLGGELGGVRDLEVLAERLGGRARDLPEEDRKAVVAVTRRLEAGVAGARAELVAALDSDRYLELLDRLIAAAAVSPVIADPQRPAAEVLPKLARTPWTRLRRAVRALPPDPPDEDLHRIRILAKRTRYAAEVAALVVGKRAARFARAAAELQGILGEHQDSVTAQAWLRQTMGRRSFVAGELTALEMRAAADARARWAAAWRALEHGVPRDWMD